MMCSSWKISVFGILALILAFGLVTTDALAQDPPNVTVTVAGDDDLRAAGTATLTFTVAVDPHPVADDQKAGVIRIIIPSDWSSPLETVGVVDAVREVSIANGTGTGDGALTGSISGRHLVVTAGKSADDTVTFVFMTDTAPTMRTHGFEIRSTAHAIVDDGNNVPPEDNDQIRKRGGRYFLDIEVGAIASGAKPDNFKLTSSVHRQPSNDDDPPHEGKFLTVSEAAFGNVVVSYDVPGTMPKGSQFIVTTVSADDIWDVTRDDSTQASQSSHMDISRTAKVITGTLKGTVQKGAKLTITLKHLKAPKVGDQPAAAINTGFTIQAQTAVEVSLTPADPTVTREEAAPTGDAQFDFVTTRADGTGRLRVHTGAPADAGDANVLTHYAAGADLGEITIRLDTLTGNAGGSKYEITLPSTGMGWPEPFKPVGTSTANGALSGDLAGDIPKADDTNNGVIAAADVVGLSYRVEKAPTTQGPHVFNAKTSAGPHGNLKALTGHTVHITAPHGSGTIDLIDKNGNAFLRATDAAEVGNLRFRYKPAGYMPKDAAIRITLPTGWTQARTDNPADGSDDPGEIAASPKAMVNVAADNASFTVTATDVWNSTDTIVITYRNVKVADIADGTTESSTFSTESKSFGDDTFAALAASPIVGIGRDPDGSGSIALSVTETDTATAIGTLMITYTAAGKMEIGSIVEITVPDTGNWPDPTDSANFVLSDTARAAQSATAATETAAATLSATTSTELGSGDTIVFMYRNVSAQPAGTHRFSATSTVTYDGTPTPLGTGPAEITVTPVVPGSVALTYVKDEMTHPLTTAAPGADLGQLSFTFTAQAAMDNGSQVQVSVPAAWYPPFRGNTADDARRGAVWVAGATVEIAPGPQAAGPWTITATPNAGLAVGATLVFTYNAGAAPVENVYTFTTMASVSSGGPLVSIASSPRVTVREPITALAVMAEPASVFVNDDVTVTVTLSDADGEGRALGDMVIMLDDGEAGGSFSDADGNAIMSVTIENLGSSASATYSNAMANPMVTVTATSGELSATADVEIKSTISNLMVDGMADPDPVRGEDSIKVTADGRAGTDVRATVVVTKTEVDADGNAVVSAVVPTLSLDIVPTAPDAPETDDVSYSRDIDLGGLDDGDYMVTVNIGDDSLSAAIEVVNDRTAPVLSEQSAWPGEVANGDQVALRVVVTSANEITSVTADVSAIDSTKEEPLTLSEQADEEGVYTRLFTIDMANTNDDGSAVASFTATDRLGNEGTADAPAITLKNDVTAPTLSMESAMPGTANDGTVVTISVSSESGLTVTADASSIGGAMMVALTEGTMMAANGNGNGNGMAANGNGNGNGMAANGNGNGNGMAANGNGNGNGMAANGNGNGNGMAANGNGNGNGMAANGNGNGNGMADAAPGNGVYTGMATVTGAADGAQTITITATDASGNSSEAMVSVMIDNTGPALTMASADPAMATNGTMITISVSTESGATVTADASAIGGDAATALAESADTAGSYSASVAVADDTMDGEHMISISASDALGNAGDDASASVTVDNTAPALADAAVTPDWALNGDTVSISVSTESGATVTADASAIGGDAATALAESADTAGMYSADVVVTDAAGGDQMVSITASDALGNMSEAATASVSIHVVTAASFSPADVSTGDTVMVSAMGTAGLTATFSVFDADGNNIVTDGSLTEDAETAGSYSGSFEVVIDAHPTGTYWVSATIGQASMTAEGALTIDHLAQFDLAIGAGTHLIHVPLDVTHIDGVEASIDTVGDLYDALGDAVNFIISLGADGTWNSYLGDESAGSAADAAIGDDTGLIAVMSSAASLTLAGNALGTGGASSITLGAGNNLVGVPLDPVAGLDMISDAVAHPAVSAVVVSNAAGNGFNTIAQAGDPGDGAIMGGVGYIVVAGAAASIPVIGAAWDNTGMMDDAGMMTAANGNGASTAPSIGFQTPVLQVQGKLIDEAGMVSRDGLNVSVKNLTSGVVLGRTTSAEDYSMTFVKLDTSAAKIGDVLEIRADSANPLIGVRPVQHVVTADDVLDSRIDLPDLVTYEIPAQTELLANYPNPFNPETWIPFRLAEDSNVSVSIYGSSGSLVRNIDIGFMPAAVYEGRSDAIYWDGRNDFGEQVSSGIYFYHLNAGDFSATRKMVIVK